MIPKTAPDFANSEESKRNLMLAPANNQDLTPLNVVSSVTFTNFAFAVGLYILLLSIISFVISILFNIFVLSFDNYINILL